MNLAQKRASNMEMEIDSGEEKKLERLKFSYIYAIGDQLMNWTCFLCLELGETDHYRLEEILSILNIWQDQFIFTKAFIDQLKVYILPQFELAKQRMIWAQHMNINSTSFEASKLNEKPMVRNIFNEQLAQINKFPETRQAVLLEAKAQQIQASDNLSILQ